MSKFNPHILLIMRWLQNGNLVSKKELRASYRTAYAAASYAARAAYDAYIAASSADYADDDAKYWLIEVKESLDKYFKLTNEDRKAYEEQARYLNILGAKNE